MPQSLKDTTFKNVSYNAIGKVVAFCFQSVANIILSRELVAEDYGVAGFAIICVSFMRQFSGLGINNAAVHAKKFDQKGMSTAFTLRLIFGVLAFAITILLSGLAEYFFAHNAIASVIKVFAIAILIDTFSFVSTILLTRSLRYSIISLAETGLVVASSITAIILSMNGFKYWSIVYAYLAANSVFVLITYVYMPYRFRLAIDVEIAKQYLRYGSTVFFTGLLFFAIYNMDNLIIGSVAGASQLGHYAIAFNWGAMVCSIMGAVVFSVLFPTFSRMQGDPVRLKQAYLKIIQYTALFSLLCNVGLFCVADNFLITVLGKGTDKWLPSLQTLRILCCYGVIRSLIEPASSLLMAQGNTKTPLKAALLVVIIEGLLVFPAIRFGRIEMVGLVVFFACISQIVIYLPVLKLDHGISAREINSIIWPALTSGIVTIIIYFIFDSIFVTGLIKLLVSMLFLTLIYLLFYGILTKFKIYRELVLLIFKK